MFSIIRPAFLFLFIYFYKKKKNVSSQYSPDNYKPLNISTGTTMKKSRNVKIGS